MAPAESRNRPYRKWLTVPILLALAAAAVDHWSRQGVGTSNVPSDLSGEERRFERALLGSAQGRPLLRDVTVYLRQVRKPDGGLRPVHLVTAQFCTGHPEQYGGASRYVWRESLFVFPIPYRPTLDLAELDPDVAAAFAQRTPPDGSQTVLDLLGAARSVHGRPFSYAWWDTHFWLLFGAGCCLLGGIALPSLIWSAGAALQRRPWSVRARPLTDAESVAPPPPAVVPDPPPPADPAEPTPVAAAPALPVPAPASSAAVPSLRAERLVPVAPPDDQDGSEFGMKPGDYYPTQRGDGRPASDGRVTE